jgi:hypothetical protein
MQHLPEFIRKVNTLHFISPRLSRAQCQTGPEPCTNYKYYKIMQHLPALIPNVPTLHFVSPKICCARPGTVDMRLNLNFCRCKKRMHHKRGLLLSAFAQLSTGHVVFDRYSHNLCMQRMWESVWQQLYQLFKACFMRQSKLVQGPRGIC